MTALHAQLPATPLTRRWLIEVDLCQEAEFPALYRRLLTQLAAHQKRRRRPIDGGQLPDKSQFYLISYAT